MTSATRQKKITGRRGTSNAKPSFGSATERIAKRLSRQQKRLEHEVGITTLPVTTPRQKVVRYDDIKEFRPLTDTQSDFFDSYENEDAIGYMLFGSAGTGKTFIALYHALLDVMNPDDDRFKKIIIIRSAVSSRDQGFLPGTLDEKMEVYEAPYHSIFHDITGKADAYEKLKDMGKVEFASSSFLRGSTFNNAIIVFDEAQNENFNTVSTVITRVGRDCKIILCGDGAQNDLVTNKNDVSGFRDVVAVTSKMEDFRHFKFTVDDIVRSPFVKAWIMACEKYGI